MVDMSAANTISKGQNIAGRGVYTARPQLTSGSIGYLLNPKIWPFFTMVFGRLRIKI